MFKAIIPLPLKDDIYTMKIYFDGHCDTLEKAFDNKKSLDFENYDFNLKDAKMNNSVIQNLAAFVHTEFEDGRDADAVRKRLCHHVQFVADVVSRLVDVNAVFKFQ